jgi:hypothetical protein
VCRCVGDCISNHLADFDAAALVKEKHVEVDWVSDVVCLYTDEYVCRSWN